MGTRAVRDVTKVLVADFSAAQTPLSLPAETRLLLQSFIDEHNDRTGEEESARASLELRKFFDNYVNKSWQKLDLFMGVLKELRQAIVGDVNIMFWAEKAAHVVRTTDHTKSAVEDARDFLIGVMVCEEDDTNALQRAKISARLRDELLQEYLSRSRNLKEDDTARLPEDEQVKYQVEDVLVALGRKRPKDLFNSIDDLLVVAANRLQALTLLNTFLRHETPHLYLVVNTPLLEHLLRCLLNDTSTTVLSLALTSLIMLLPHTAGSLGSYLPRLFLIYSRILCWEKFSELSTEAQRNLVTDDRVSRDEDEQESGSHSREVGVDSNWDRARPQAGLIEATTPELMTYFTYLYGLYPLNLMSYIRKPRRYLRNADFPGAEAFDLDRSVLRSRTEQFRRMHFVHPNFYNLTVEEELVDPKWPKMDPSDVVGHCQALCVYSKPLVSSPLPPPTVKLPDIPPIPLLSDIENLKVDNQLSPAASHASLRSGNSLFDSQSTAITTGEDSPLPNSQSEYSKIGVSAGHRMTSSNADQLEPSTSTNIAHLQRQVTLLRNDLNFERWHKAQYSEHISQIMRRNVKEATAEAETLNLINANRALRKQLEQLQKAREATIKDSTLTRKQANNLEAHMTERFNKLKLEQETWQADADELRRLRLETKQYRDLLVSIEARELNKSHQLQMAEHDLQQLKSIQEELQQARTRLREYQTREFEFETAIRERDILEDENRRLCGRLQIDSPSLDQSRPTSSSYKPLKRRVSDPNRVRPALPLATLPPSGTQTQLPKVRSKTIASKAPRR